MKYFFFIVTLITTNILVAQCPFNITLNNTGGNCPDTPTFHLTTQDSITQIIWYNGNLAIDTIKAAASGSSATTVAGGNGNGAASNQLAGPWKIYVDKHRNVYVADADNHRIQKWEPGATSGITIAGGNGAGNGADQLNDPLDVHVDDNGNIYIADNANYRIQKWAAGSTSGVTIAGGNGAGIATNQFLTVNSIFVDNAGYIYLSDLTNDRVQKWVPGATSGITVAGGNGPGPGTDQLNAPTDVFVDNTGNVYVTDGGNYRVQKWAPGALSGVTVAGGNGIGSASNQFNGTAGLYVGNDGSVYLADASNHRIQKWMPGSSNGVTVAGGNGYGSSPNQLAYPNGVYVDNDGAIYIADLYNSRIQKWILHSTISLEYMPMAPGTYKAVVINNAGCSVTTNSIVINPTVTPSLNINTAATIVCEGAAVTFTASISDAGNNPIYQWQVNGINAGTNNPVFTSNNLANGSLVRCLLTSDASCSTSSTTFSNNISVTINALADPAVQIAATATTICLGMPITFTAKPTNGGTIPIYQWQVNGNNAGTNYFIYTTNSLSNGDIVTCILFNPGSCSSSPTAVSNKITVSVSSVIPSVNITASDTIICSGSSANFIAVAVNAGNSPVYQWRINEINKGRDSNTFISSDLKNGDIISCIVVNDKKCTSSSNAIVVTVNPLPVIIAGQSVSISPGQSITLNPIVTGNAATYSWSPFIGLSDTTIKNPVANPSVSTFYKLEVTTIEGCKSNEIIEVKVFTQINIPNAFTPNGDGRNDIFYILGGREGCQIKDFSIFNRWGEKVFQVHKVLPNDPGFGWNGDYNGVKSLPGAYIYAVTLTLADGSIEAYKGTVMLIR